jgi:hypothetical protein
MMLRARLHLSLEKRGFDSKEFESLFCSGPSVWCVTSFCFTLQGCLAHAKLPPLRTLQEDNAYSPSGALGEDGSFS